jgi:two-component system cell cycle response regulator PopA
MAKPQILVLADDDAARVFAQAGFSLCGADNQKAQTAAVIIDARGPAGAKAGELARSLKGALGPRSGLFLAWTDAQSDYDSTHFDGSLDSTAPPASLAARLHSSLRIAVMADEARLRFKSLAQFGGSPRPPNFKNVGAPRILVFGHPGRETLRLSAALEARGAQTIATFTSFTAFDYLHDGDFDGVAVLAHDETSPTLSFSAALRRNARLFHLPCLVVGAAEHVNPDDAIRRGATDVSHPGDEDQAAERLLQHVDEKRSRDAIALAFAAARAPQAMDQATGLYSQTFFRSHLDRLVARAHETARPLGVALVRIAPDSVTLSLRDGRGLDRIVGQAGAMLSRLVRAEDVAACLDRTTFAIAFPASDADAADSAARRIAAVLECTAFDSGSATRPFDNDAPIQIKLQIASADVLSGESARDFLARASARLPYERL